MLAYQSKVPARNGLHKRRISRGELRSFGRLCHILMQCCRGSDLDPLCLGSHVDTLVKNDFYHLDVGLLLFLRIAASVGSFAWRRQELKSARAMTVQVNVHSKLVVCCTGH